MRLDEIKYLLEKYYEGKTSTEEEKTLVKFFSEEVVPEELLPEKDMFLFYQDEKSEKIAGESDIEALVLESIQEIEAKEVGGKNTVTRTIRLKNYIQIGWQAAAVVLILFGGYYMIERMSPVVNLEDTYRNNPELAMAETKKVFSLLSETLNKGMGELEPVEVIDVADHELKKTKKIKTANTELTKIADVGRGMDELNKILSKALNTDDKK